MDKLDAAKMRIRRNSESIDRVQYCIDNGSELTDWEDIFLSDILEKLMKGYSLTSGQEEKLSQIEYKVEFGTEAYWEEFGG